MMSERPISLSPHCGAKNRSLNTAGSTSTIKALVGTVPLFDHASPQSGQPEYHRHTRDTARTERGQREQRSRHQPRPPDPLLLLREEIPLQHGERHEHVDGKGEHGEKWSSERLRIESHRTLVNHQPEKHPESEEEHATRREERP